MLSVKRLCSLVSRKQVNSAVCCNQVNFSATTKVPIPKNPLRETFSANNQADNGAIYDKKPFRLTLEAGKKYSWCLCGKSHNQPLCDGTHKSIYLKIKQRPIRFTVEETKEYWLCNCKQTKNRPFCDGTHKRQDIQDAHVKI